MLITALVLFAIAALGGLTLAYLVFTRNAAPTPLALVHGALAAVALILLIIGMIKGAAGGLLTAALILFLIAAAGGFTLFLGFQLRKKILPRPLVLVHGAAAVVGFVLLVIFVARG